MRNLGRFLRAPLTAHVKMSENAPYGSLSHFYSLYNILTGISKMKFLNSPQGRILRNLGRFLRALLTAHVKMSENAPYGSLSRFCFKRNAHCFLKDSDDLRTRIFIVSNKAIIDKRKASTFVKRVGTFYSVKRKNAKNLKKECVNEAY